MLVCGPEMAWGCLGLLVDRWQALAISSFDQLHLVQNFE